MKVLSMTSLDNLTELVIDMETRKHVSGNSFSFRLEKAENGSFVASIIQDNHNPHKDDDVGALYYVIVVILIYGCSILMMIASYIRKNNVDRKLNRYIKDMALVRKRERQMQLLGAAARAASIIPEVNDEKCRGSISGYSFIASRVNALPCPLEEENEEDNQENVPLNRTPAPSSSPILPAITLEPKFLDNKTPSRVPSPEPGPIAGSVVAGGISSLLKDALMSGVAVGMWEGNKRKDRGVTIKCDFVDSDYDNTHDEDTDCGGTDYSKTHLHSPAPSDFDTTPEFGPSTGNSSCCSPAKSSTSSSEFFSPDVTRKCSVPYLLAPVRPDLSLKRHSMPNEADLNKETDLSFLNTKFLPLSPPPPRRGSECSSYKDLQVVSSV